MINVKLSELLDSTETLKKLSQKDFKAKLAWSISRLLKAAEQEIQEFNDTRMNLINKYGEKGDDGQLVTDEKGNCHIVPESIQEFSNELNELINTEVEINANPIDIELLEDLEFTPAEMSQLEPFIHMGE